MIGLDTNILVRYITQDDARQSEKANQLIEGELTQETPGFVALIVVVELVWVLESCYKQDKDSIVTVLEALLSSKQLVLESADIIYRGLKTFREKGGDFSDTIIAQRGFDSGCARIMTFDKKARLTGMELL